MRAKPSRLTLLLLALLLAAASGRAEEKTTVPRLPPGVRPLPPESARRVEELLHTAETYRGLKALRRVPAGAMSPRKLKAKLREALPKDLPPSDLRALEVSLKAFGLIPETMDLGRYLPELLSSQVAGFYDPDGKYLVMVDPVRSAARKGEKQADEDMVLVHELTHALQDQRFDLQRLEDADPLSDGGSARKALIEGDATLVMLDASLKTRFEAAPGLDTVMAAMMKDPDQMLAGNPDLPGAREMRAAPAWLRDNLTFSYFQGFAFCVSALRTGGQPLLDYAFTTDPPRSTEQILHPEKWHSRRDDPVVLRFPDLAVELPGYHKAAEGEMGELGVRVLLRESLRDRERAEATAAGWGGDRFAVYEKSGGRLVLWITEWDSEADAMELRAALPSLLGWRAEAAGPTRVVAIRGSLPEETWEKVRARLAGAAAERPANKEIDLKALTPRSAAPSPADGR